MTTGPAARPTAAQVRELLSERKIFPELPPDLGDDTEIALDSLGLVWFLHELEQRYGLILEPSDADLAGLTSVRRIVAYLRAAEPVGGTDVP